MVVHELWIEWLYEPQASAAEHSKTTSSGRMASDPEHRSNGVDYTNERSISRSSLIPGECRAAHVMGEHLKKCSNSLGSIGTRPTMNDLRAESMTTCTRVFVRMQRIAREVLCGDASSSSCLQSRILRGQNRRNPQKSTLPSHNNASRHLELVCPNERASPPSEDSGFAAERGSDQQAPRICLHLDVLSKQAKDPSKDPSTSPVYLVQATIRRADDLPILTGKILEVQSPETLLAELDGSGKIMLCGNFGAAGFL